MKFSTVFWVALIVVLIADVVAAMEFANIAEMKGHSGSKYFWWCFLLALYGIPMVIALPDRKGQPREDAVQVQDEALPEL